MHVLVVEQVTFDPLDAIFDLLEILKLSGTQIVDNAYLVAAFDECLHKMRTDESSATGDEYLSHG